jgi:hypothetical protein
MAVPTDIDLLSVESWHQYYWLLVRATFTKAASIFGGANLLLAFVAWGLAKQYPEWEARLNDLAWQIPAGLGLVTLALRWIVAPYEIHRLALKQADKKLVAAGDKLYDVKRDLATRDAEIAAHRKSDQAQEDASTFSVLVSRDTRNPTTRHVPPDNRDIIVSAVVILTNLVNRELALTPFLRFSANAFDLQCQAVGVVRLTPRAQSQTVEIKCVVPHDDAQALRAASHSDKAYCDPVRFSEARLVLRDEATGKIAEAPPYFSIPAEGIVLRP